MTRKRADNRKPKKTKGQLMQRPRESKGANAEKRPHSGRLRDALILVFSGIVIFSACVFLVNWHSVSPQAEDGATRAPYAAVNVPRAAVLDGLYDIAPNSTLIESMVQYLSNSGYMVDVYRGTNVTIDLLRNIGGYKILILRLHSAVHTDGFLYVFSGEKYTESKYINEQLSGAVRKGYTFDESEPPYFALNSVFLGKLAPNGLNGTTLIMMGCNGSASQYVIQRFSQEGIKAYISWDGYVNLPHSDEATLRLVKAMCLEGLSPKAAIEEVNKEVGPDPSYKSKLICALP